MSRAIAMLCILSDENVIGAILASAQHRKFCGDCHLIVMCDNIIFEKHHMLLAMYFDNVVEIELWNLSLPGVSESNPLTKSVNRWQFLSLTQYEKILYVDINVLPVDAQFYDIFNNSSPSVLLIQKEGKKWKNPTSYEPKATNYLDYLQEEPFITMSNNIALLNPNKEDYNAYLKMFSEYDIEHKRPFSPDETTMFYYLTRKYQISLIDPACCRPSYFKTKLPTHGIQFHSKIKSWNKHTHLMAKDERIWYDIWVSIKEKAPMELKHMQKENVKKYIKAFLKDRNRKLYNIPTDKQIESIEKIVANDRKSKEKTKEKNKSKNRRTRTRKPKEPATDSQPSGASSPPEEKMTA